jgi:hypothetical protein
MDDYLKKKYNITPALLTEYETFIDDNLGTELEEQKEKAAELYNNCFGDPKEYALRLGKLLLEKAKTENTGDTGEFNTWHIYINPLMRTNAVRIMRESKSKTNKNDVGEYPRIELADWFIQIATYRDIYEMVAHEVSHVIRESMIDRLDSKDYKIHDDQWKEIARRYSVEDTVCLKKKFYLGEDGSIRKVVKDALKIKLEGGEKLPKWQLRCEQGCRIAQLRWSGKSKQKIFKCKEHLLECKRYERTKKDDGYDLYVPPDSMNPFELELAFGFGFGAEEVMVEDGDILDEDGKSLTTDMCIPIDGLEI